MLDRNVDFIVMSAVEDEFQYFTDFVKPDFETNVKWHPGHGLMDRPFLIGHFRVARNSSYFTVLAAQARSMGGTHSIVRTALLLMEK